MIAPNLTPYLPISCNTKICQAWEVTILKSRHQLEIKNKILIVRCPLHCGRSRSPLGTQDGRYSQWGDSREISCARHMESCPNRAKNQLHVYRYHCVRLIVQSHSLSLSAYQVWWRWPSELAGQGPIPPRLFSP